MAINWTEAQIEEIVQKVVSQFKPAAETAESKTWTPTSYLGRPFVGIFDEMKDAIAAAEVGYRAVRAMSVAEREKLITVIRGMIREEASIMAAIGVAETKMVGWTTRPPSIFWWRIRPPAPRTSFPRQGRETTVSP